MMFQGDKVKEFKYAFLSFITILVLGIVLFGTAFLFRSESFSNACQAVQDNNTKLIIYLEESKERAFKRVEVEESEGKKPVSSKQEIDKSINPLIQTLEPVEC